MGIPPKHFCYFALKLDDALGIKSTEKTVVTEGRERKKAEPRYNEGYFAPKYRSHVFSKARIIHTNEY